MSSAYLRLAIAVVTIVDAAALAIYPMLGGEGKPGLVIDALGAAALLLLLVPLLWRSHGVWAAPFLLGAEYVLADSGGQVAAVSVVPYAAGLIALCELVFWLAELPPETAVDRVAITSRLYSLALIGVAAALLAMLTLLATSVRLSSALEALVLGALAAAAILAIPLLLLRRRSWS